MCDCVMRTFNILPILAQSRLCHSKNSWSSLKSSISLHSKLYKFMSISSMSTSTNTIFEGEADRFNGVTVTSSQEYCDANKFNSRLEDSLKYWRENQRRAIWFKVFLHHAEWVPVLVKKGFKYHHAKDDFVMMYLWLSSEIDNLPKYAHTMLGVGAMVVNDKSQVLVVREKYATRLYWKLPGGYVEPGEDLVDAAIREVLEETNIKTEFQSVIAFRHAHKFMFKCSDIYVVVSLKPLTTAITKCNQEIAECLWMDIEDYLKHPNIHHMNKLLMEKYLEYKKGDIKIECANLIHQILNIPYNFYSVSRTAEPIENVCNSEEKS